MPLIKYFAFLLFLFAAPAFTSLSIAQDYRSGTLPAIPYGHKIVAPPGMSYVPGGSTLINYDQSTIDTNSIKKISLTSFFMDQTETTNLEYRTFVNWVVDSIAIVKYLKDPKYFKDFNDKKGSKKSDKESGSTTAPAASNNTTTVAVAATDSAKTGGDSTKTSMTTTTVTTVNSADTTAPDTTDYSKKRINWAKVDHDKIFNSNNEEIKKKIAPMLDDNGNVRRDAYTFNYKYVKVVSSASHNGKNQVKTESINIYPDENVWAEDLTNATTDMYVENYFKASAFNDYPVVGITWSQARAYCYWRGLSSSAYYNMPEYMKSYRPVYTLPSEAQWVYAAQGFYELVFPEDTAIADTSSYQSGDSLGTVVLPADSTQTPHDSAFVAAAVHKKYVDDSVKSSIRDQKMAEKQKTTVHKKKQAMNPNLYVMDYVKMLYFFNHRYTGSIDTTKAIDSTMIHRDPNGMLMNFKQSEGDYWEDGAAMTTPVMSFAPNEYGIYNMEGNVSEWTLDAYSPSAYSFVSDLNPVLLYDADSTDADVMKRKVVRGGSFMGNAKSLSPFYRDLELQGTPHCYLGFRCIMQAPEIITKSDASRNRTIRGKRTKGKFSGARLPEIH